MAARARRSKVRSRSSGSPASSATSGPPAPASEARSGLRMRLQILAGVFLPGALVLLWLNSRGFFQSP